MFFFFFFRSSVLIYFNHLFQYIPMPVLYGVFLYMGVASLSGIQVRWKLWMISSYLNYTFIHLSWSWGCIPVAFRCRQCYSLDKLPDYYRKLKEKNNNLPNFRVQFCHLCSCLEYQVVQLKPYCLVPFILFDGVLIIWWIVNKSCPPPIHF